MEEKSMFHTLKDKMKGQEVKDLLDYDFKVLQINFLRMINDYNYAIYQQDDTFDFSKICDNNFAEKTKKNILSDKKYYKNNKVSINCSNIKCVKETFETIKFISDMDISYHVKVIYNRTNTYSGEVVRNEKEYDEVLTFKNYEEGWKISKVRSQDDLIHNTETLL